MKSKRFPIILGVAVAVAVAATLYVFHTNDLGLTGFYILLGGHPKMDTLRANTRATADTFLAKHKNDLVDPSDAVNGLAVDYSKSAEVRARGYRSSFYYYCWDIYLPYSLRT